MIDVEGWCMLIDTLNKTTKCIKYGVRKEEEEASENWPDDDL